LIDIEDGGDDLYQAVLDDLIGALLSIFPDLDLSKEIVVCSSHASAVKYSAHVMLLRFIMNTEGSKDLKHLYDIIKQRMDPDHFKFIDQAFCSFKKNLRVLGSTKGIRTSVFVKTQWKYNEENIITQLPNAIDDYGMDETYDNFHKWFTKGPRTNLIPITIFRACSLYDWGEDQAQCKKFSLVAIGQMSSSSWLA